jgi:hypothetical protein
MKTAVGILVIVLLAPLALAQSPASAVADAGMVPPSALPLSVFPGGITLRIKNDEMTDKRTCTISTPLRGIYLEFYGRAGASVWTSDALKLDYSVKPQMRLGADELFELETSRHPHPMFVPSKHIADVVRALYSGAKVRVRFVLWPSGDARTIEIEQGDFASAYDRGAQFCGWPEPGVSRAVLSHQPKVRTGDDLIESSFGGDSQWIVHYFPQLGSCYIAAPSGKQLIAFHDGGAPSSHDFGSLRIYRSTGELVRTIEQPGRSVVPVRQLLAAAALVGDDGMLELGGELHSLFGLADAALFAEKSCGVHLP